MNSQSNLIAPGATINPGEFALGSPESRAAARAMHKAKHVLSEDDLRCWAVFRVASMKAPQTPSGRDAHGTEPYERGWAIEQVEHPIVPSHLDPTYGKYDLSSYVFHGLHCRYPNVGDVLRYSELEAAFDPRVEAAHMDALKKAWEAKLPALPFPLKWQGRRIYALERDPQTRETAWVENVHGQPAPECEWRTIESEIIRSQTPRNPYLSGNAVMPITPAVIFYVNTTGEYKVRPYAD